MNKNLKGLVVVAIVGLVAFSAYTYYRNEKRRIVTPDFSSKESIASYLVNHGLASDSKVLLTFDEEYLRAWAEAAEKGTINFTYNGKLYALKGGRAL